MEGKDNIKELFSQKLGNYEAKVNPDLWANISAQVATGATTTAAAGGLSLFAKVAIGIGVSAAAITTVVVLSTSGEEAVSNKPIIEVQETTPKSNEVETNEVAEAKTQKTIEYKQFRDVTKYLTNSTNSNSNSSIESTPAKSTPTTASAASTEQTPDRSITKMPMRNAETVNGTTASEPQIVEGVVHQGMSSYGRAAVNQQDEVAESVTPKVEPIKRFVNAFTPNGDGTNDYFELPSDGLIDFSVTVLNPQGDIVFQSDNPNFRWDGRDMRTGEMVESGTYMYMVAAKDSEGNPYPIYERLTVISK